MIFMVDSGAEHSVVTTPVAPLIQYRATKVGATSTQTAQQFCQPQICQLGGYKVTHKSICLPECPIHHGTPHCWAGGDDYQSVLDLLAVNNAIITLHSVVPNPYILLSLLPPQTSWFTCLDLKDAFFCLNLAPVSQPLFVFEWEDPHIGSKTQMTWNRLP
jgi:hypothetical protein